MKRLAALALLASFFLVGCFGPERPPMAPVQGRVTYHAKPVTDANVEFLCPGAPRPASGTTDAQGNYRLSTYEQNDGAIIGTHVVTVIKYAFDEQTSPMQSVPEGKSLNEAIEEDMRRTALAIEKARKAKPPLPPKYGSRNTSDLRKEVVDDDNVINIELTD